MKRKEFIEELQRAGCRLALTGARHDIYVNPLNALKQPVPRHAEISDVLGRHTTKFLSIE